MHEFDEYINSIIGSLNVSKKKNDEMADEYRDHLYMLKRDYIKSGLSDEVAIKEAIKIFGDSKILKTKLSNNLISFRSVPNILFGIVFTILWFIIGSRISVPGLGPNFFPLEHTYYLVLLICFILMFIPVGYFLPIIFKIKSITLEYSVISIIIGIIVSYNFNFGLLRIVNIAIVTLGVLLGSILGVTILKMVNRVVLKYRYS